MFGNYAIAIGRGRHRHAIGERAAALGLPVRTQTGALLLVASQRTAFLCDGDVVLVGQAFDQSGEPLTSLGAELADLGHCGDPRPVLRRYWGNYALFFASEDKDFVYREPSGSVPVYRCGADDQAVFVSDAEIALQLGLLKHPDVDSRFVAHWLQFPFLRTARTGLQNVSELLPGMCTSRTGSGGWIEAPAWHPSAFASRTRAIDDPLEAASRLRETALSVVAAQPSATNIALRLSGGLDSSIIGACLACSKVRFSCINFATRAPDGDEREYAREVARSFGRKLVEIREPEPARLGPPLRRSFRPLINPLLEPFERAIAEAAGGLGSNLLVDGGGGDNLFCSITSSAPVLDVLATGSVAKAAAAVADVASRAECTIWDVLLAAGRSALRRRALWKEDRSFLMARTMLRKCDPHPWLQGLGVPQGKREHVEALVHVQHFLDRTSSSIPLLHPLLAQPLLEICLRIPSWLWVRGGRDRAIARDAFEGLVPSSVLQRRMKGSLQSLLYRSFEQLRVDMRELLLEGELARSGIIDSPAVDQALTSEAWMTDRVQLRISEMVALELWVRSWTREPADASTGS